MSCAKNHPTQRKVETQSASGFTVNVSVVELFLSCESQFYNNHILITAVKEKYKTEKRISLKLDHHGDFGCLQLKYIGLRFNHYFPSDAIVKVSEILLKNSNTKSGDVYEGNWDVIHIITENENDCNFLFKQAVNYKYTVILAVLLKIIDANNSSRQLIFQPYGSFLLHRAVANKDMKVIQTLLKFKFGVNTRNKSGWTPLLVAVNLKMPDIVDFLISNNADVNIGNKKLQVPLHLAAERNNLKILDSLLKRHVKLDVIDNDGQTPLHYAVNAGNVNVVDILLKKGANYKSQDKFGCTPLHLAAQQKDLDIIEIFLKHTVDVNILNSRKQTPLFYLSENPSHPLPKAVEEETYSTIIDIFLQNGAKINFQDSKGHTLVHYAVIHGNIRCLRALLNFNIDVNAVNIEGKTVLHVAVETKNYDAVKLILKKNLNIDVKDSNGQIALHSAIESEYFPIIELLLINGASVHSKNSSGKTPLNATMYLKNKSIILKCVKVLLDHKADVNGVDRDLTSPLHLACLIKNAKVVQYLIENGANSSMRDKNGKTVFHYACMQQCKGITLAIEFVREYVKDTLNILVEENTSINCIDKFGKTPLHYVVKHKNLSFMNKLLLNIGADINIVDKDNLSPFDELYKQIFHSNNDLATLYKQHVVKMKVMKLWVREKTHNRIYKAYNERHSDWIQFYERACKREIDSMKIIHLAESNITYYDFLKKSPHDAINYTYNSIAVEAIKSDELMSMFPSYSHFLKCHLYKVLQRRNLCDQIYELLKLYIFKKLPTPCMHEILRYLDISDLTKFLKAMKPAVLVK